MIRKMYAGEVIVGQLVAGYIEYSFDNETETKKYMSIDTFIALPDAPAW